jgi:hypothetical protein
MRFTRFARLAPALAVAGLLAACVDQPTAVESPLAFRPGLASAPPSLAVSGGPDLSDFLSFQGEIWICKDGNVAGVPFSFDYTVTRQSDGVVVANGSTTVPVGQCVMAANVSTEASGRYVATATETTTLPDWSLTAIDWAYGANLPFTPAAPTINLATRTISALLLSNDIGVQITFTNSYTPPPPPPVSCTYTQGYWKNHEEDWDAGEKYADAGDTFYNSGKTYLQILRTPPSGGNAYLQLAHQFIAASLNVNGTSGSGVASVDAALAGAAAYFAGAPAGTPKPSGALKTQLQSWATLLDDYNNGLIGPGHCD